MGPHSNTECLLDPTDGTRHLCSSINRRWSQFRLCEREMGPAASRRSRCWIFSKHSISGQMVILDHTGVSIPTRKPRGTSKVDLRTLALVHAGSRGHDEPVTARSDHVGVSKRLNVRLLGLKTTGARSGRTGFMIDEWERAYSRFTTSPEIILVQEKVVQYQAPESLNPRWDRAFD